MENPEQSHRGNFWRPVKKTAYLVGAFLTGVAVVGGIVLFLYIRSLPPLSIWHTTLLEEEFTEHSGVKDFEGYVALEARLFGELERRIVEKVPKREQKILNRYTRNSLSNPERWERNWNRSFELPVDDPKMGVLLLHGMSDSPYSLHEQAERLHQQGVWVVGIRLPGHGTAPSGLTRVRWQDMAAAVKIGMARLQEKVGEKPLYIMGYSTGATLGLHYTFQAMEDAALSVPSGLILFSPAIGVSAMAPLAVWQKRFASLLSLPKLEWNAIGPEYDPFKYNSFAINAADQVYRLCAIVQKEFDRHEDDAAFMKAFPPVLAFQSAVDNTVSVADTVEHLYNRLPKGDHTLVLFDIHHRFNRHMLVREQTMRAIDALKSAADGRPYRFDLLTDSNTTDGHLQLYRNGKFVSDLPYRWPASLFSLSHVALPFPPDDPLYGNSDAPQSPGVQLGTLAAYGESAVLQIGPAAMLRLRWNPFYGYMNARVASFLKLK